MKKLMTSLAVIGQFSISSLAVANSDVVAYPDNGHSYQRIDTGTTWQDAKAYCEEQGGYLATITSAAENRFVYEQVGKDGVDIFLGGTDRFEEGQWEWVTGETWDYENWVGDSPGSPNQVAYYSKVASKWVVLGQDYKRAFICEWNNTNGVDDPISIAKQEGRQACIDNPPSCGIQSGECPAPTTPSKPAPSGSSESADNCTATDPVTSCADGNQCSQVWYAPPEASDCSNVPIDRFRAVDGNLWHNPLRFQSSGTFSQSDGTQYDVTEFAPPYQNAMEGFFQIRHACQASWYSGDKDLPWVPANVVGAIEYCVYPDNIEEVVNHLQAVADKLACENNLPQCNR